MTEGGELTGRCHCGAVTVRIPRKPDYVNECNCSLCATTGFRGIYFGSEELQISGPLDEYVRADMSEPMLKQLRCAKCGTATHWELLTPPPYERMGVNANLFGEEVLAGVEVKAVDGRNWAL